MMRIVMMGTGTFAEPTLRVLLDRGEQVVGVVTQPDREIGQKRSSTRQVGQGIKTIAQAAGVPVVQPESINTAEGLSALHDFRPDLLVVVAYGQILSAEALAAARLGGINIHASLLPKYRGAAPIAWAIWQGETETGVSIIRMTPGLDAGDILAQEAVVILPDETAGELEARLAPIGARLAWEVIQKLKQGPVTGRKQDPALVTKAPKLRKEMGLIDWSRRASQVWNQIRAVQPWPTPYTFLHRAGHPTCRVLIPDAVPIDETNRPGPPGAILVEPTHEGERALFTRCGEGTLLRILALQPAGKRLMSAADFLRGHPLQPGDHFGAETT